MYKKQLTLQKILCFLALVSSVIIFLYALGIMTDLYDTLYSTMRNPADLTQTDVEGSIVYYNMQGWNSYFLHCSIVLILLACLLFITNTHIRRKYYVGNFIAVGAFVLANFYVAWESHASITAFKARFMLIDFAALLEHADLWKTYYTESTFWFDVHYAVFALSILVSLGLIACTVWKIVLMNEEKKLLEAGRKGAAA